MSAIPITVDSVGDYLLRRGIPSSNPRVTALVGGVSGTVLLVEMEGRRLVVKQALDQLLVAGDWFAKPERALTEAAALKALHSFTPDFLPELVDASAADCALVMTAAPGDWPTWKTRLLADDFDCSAERGAARSLGVVLGSWHRETTGDAVLAQRFDDYEAFEQLRVDPFHRTILGRHPLLAPAVEQCIADLTEARECLVHGDFSPKNILVDPADPANLWVLDFEVAHYGAAVFDLAFLHCHLVLKAIHLPVRAEAMSDLAATFQGAYDAEAGAIGSHSARRLGWQTACLLLARVDGTSPAGYLTAPQQERVRDFATYLLSTADRPITDLWALLTEESHDEHDSH